MTVLKETIREVMIPVSYFLVMVGTVKNPEIKAKLYYTNISFKN